MIVCNIVSGKLEEERKRKKEKKEVRTRERERERNGALACLSLLHYAH